jgi:predicted DNA-binding ribbon-helix-helix protein
MCFKVALLLCFVYNFNMFNNKLKGEGVRMSINNSTKKLHDITSLQGKNITVMGRRTSIRLEPEMWKMLYEVAEKEDTTIHEICSLIALRKRAEASLTSSIRVFLLLYFRSATTRDGHRNAGHGDFNTMLTRAKVSVNLKTGAPLGAAVLASQNQMQRYS